MSELGLPGKIAVVTGASAGIGQATARALAAAGMTVVATARRLDRLEALAGSDDRIVARSMDVAEPEQITALAGWVEEQFRACHVLVNNAGIGSSNSLRGPDDVADFEHTIAVNLLGPMRCMAAFAELLFRSAPGRVINVASVAGKVGAGPPAYVSSKFGLVGFSEAVGPDWARRGVTVSQVNPGYIRSEQFPQEGLLRSPFGRRLVSEPEVVAEAIVDVARKGTPERTVPRWYRVAPLLRHGAAPLYWYAARRGAW
jgi:NAD(P)-dependent dehydrogenase (short-subunit alcohol dehydrogenase family)